LRGFKIGIMPQIARFFSGSGHEMVSPSINHQKIRQNKRIGFSESHDVEIMDSDDMQGIKVREKLHLWISDTALRGKYFDHMQKEKRGVTEIEFRSADCAG